MTNNKSQLAEALAKAQSEFPVIEKNRVVEVPGKFSYRYADLTDVVNKIRPILGKHGLSFSQGVIGEPGKETLRTTILHVGGEKLEGDVPFIAPHGSGPQAVGSALTYSRRYGLSSLLGIVTDQDDDGKIAEESNAKKTELRVAVANKAPTQGKPALPLSGSPELPPGEAPICCGKPMRVSKWSKNEAEDYYWCGTCKAKAGRF